MSHNLKGSPAQGRKRIDEIAAGVNAKFGAHVALPLDKAAVARVLKLPFGVLELDYRAGGGIPLNKITRIWGKPSSLKSTTCLRLVRNAQRYCRHCVTGDTVVQGKVLAVQRMRYTGELVKVIVESKHTLLLTPNHRVVAKHAFVKAGELKEGQYLFGHNGSQQLPAFAGMVNEQSKHYQPTPIQEIFSAFAERFGSSTYGIGANDFHGDAAFGDGKVEVVTANGKLLFSTDSQNFQSFSEPVFVIDAMGAPASYLPQIMGEGRLLDFFGGAFRSSYGVPSASALSLDDGGVITAEPPTIPLELGRFGAASQLDTPLLEPETYDLACHAKFVRELLHRGTGEITLNKIIHIERYPFSGHVYDLQTTTGWMIADNILISNCKQPLVENPKTKQMDCNCPNPRWKLVDQTQFAHFKDDFYDMSFDILYGRLPKGTKTTKGERALLVLPGTKTKIEFMQADRCEPFRCLYIDTENSVDEAWARANGVDTSLLLLMGGNWAEQILDMTEDIILTTEFDLIILDSLDMLTPGDTLSKALVQTPKIASKAGIMTRAMQKWTSAGSAGGLLNRYTPTIVIVAQVRARDIGKAWASIGPTGGWAIGHGIALDVKLVPKKYEYKGDQALFGNFEFGIPKSKVGGFPRSKGLFRFWLRPGKGRMVGDTEDIETVIEYGLTYEFLKKKPGWILFSQFLDGGKEKFKTKKAMIKYLNENSSVYLDLRNRVLSYLIGEDISIVLPSEKLEKEEKKKEKRKGLIKVKKKKKNSEEDDDLAAALHVASLV